MRVYLRKMGTVPLLTREGEVDLAKRIEEGTNKVRDALFESTVVIDGKAVQPERIDVDALYRDGPMNKHHTKPGNKPTK